MKKTRPCVIISPNEMNKYLNTIVLAPMTSSLKNYPTRVEVMHENKASSIVLDQIRTVDRQRIIKVLDSLTGEEILKVKEVIREAFVD